MHSLGQTVNSKDIEDMIKEADTNCKLSFFMAHIL